MSEIKKWVLVIDDTSASRKMIGNNLHKKGFQVVLAEDGERAVNILRYCTPDCILLDLVMPKMHGYAFLSQLRERDKNLPVIIMSPVINKSNLVATIEGLGIQGWFQKPVNIEDMEKCILEAVESRQTKTQSDSVKTDNRDNGA